MLISSGQQQTDTYIRGRKKTLFWWVISNIAKKVNSCPNIQHYQTPSLILTHTHWYTNTGYWLYKFWSFVNVCSCTGFYERQRVETFPDLLESDEQWLKRLGHLKQAIAVNIKLRRFRSKGLRGKIFKGNSNEKIVPSQFLSCVSF